VGHDALGLDAMGLDIEELDALELDSIEPNKELDAMESDTGPEVLCRNLLVWVMWSFVYQNISIIKLITRNRTNPCRIRL
jgi:hypothetical protein